MVDDYKYLRAMDPQEFFRAVASAYGIDPQQLMALDKDFELIPRGQSKRKKRPPVLQPELNEPWKSWVYLRYIANQISYKNDGQMMNPDKRIFVRSLAKEVEYRFGGISSPELRKQIKEIRTTAYNDKRKSREQDIPPEEVAIQRGIEQEAIRIFFNTRPIFAAGIQLTF